MTRNTFLSRGVFQIGPDGLEIPRNFPLGYPEWAAEAVESFVNASVCDLVGAQEAFFRSVGASALAHRAAISRLVGGCYVGDPPDLVVGQEPPPFEGGQCPGTLYNVQFSIRFAQGSPPEIATVGTYGPVEFAGVRVSPTDPTRQQVVALGHTLSGAPETRLAFQTAPGGTVTLTASPVVTAVSGPDNCGSLPSGPVEYPPGVELPPVPVPGEPITPPGVTEPVFPLPNVLVPVVLAYGSAKIDVNGTVNVDVGGFNVSIYPDLSFEIGDRGIDDVDNPGHEFEDEVSDQVRTVGDGVRAVEDGNERIEDAVGANIQGAVSGVGCDGNEVTVGYSGTGLLGVQSQVESAVEVIASLLNGLCPVGGQDPVYELLPLGSFGPVSRRLFFDVDLPDGAEYVFVDATTTFPAYAVAADGNDDQDSVQSRFAQVSFLWNLEGEFFSLPASQQFYSNGAFVVPLGLPSGSKIRISGYPGARFTLSAIRRI